MGIFDFLFGKNKKNNTKNTELLNATNQNNSDKDNDFDIYLTDPYSIDPIERSELFRNNHLENIYGFEDFTDKDILDRELNPIELSFLEYLDGATPDGIAGYWTHEIGLDISSTIKAFLASGYLEYRKCPEKLLTGAELKKLLKDKGLKTSGKKAELVDRFLEAYSKEERDALDVKKVFTLTDKGENLIADIPYSITKNSKLDQECINLIMHDKLDKAYIKVIEHRMNKPTEKGNRDYWLREINELRTFNNNLDLYQKFLSLDTYDNEENRKLFNSIIVYGSMLGKNTIPDYFIEMYIPNFKQSPTEDDIKNVLEIQSLKYSNFKYDNNIGSIKNSYDKSYEYNRIGLIYEQTGRIDKAIPYYEKAVENGFFSDSTFNKLIYFYEKNNYLNDVSRLEKRKKQLDDLGKY